LIGKNLNLFDNLTDTGYIETDGKTPS